MQNLGLINNKLQFVLYILISTWSGTMDRTRWFAAASRARRRYFARTGGRPLREGPGHCCCVATVTCATGMLCPRLHLGLLQLAVLTLQEGMIQLRNTSWVSCCYPLMFLSVFYECLNNRSKWFVEKNHPKYKMWYRYIRRMDYIGWVSCCRYKYII